MLYFGLFLSLLVVVSSAPHGVHVPPPPQATLTHVSPSQVLVKIDDDHLDSLEDIHEDHLDALEDQQEAHRDAIEDHRDAIEDQQEAHRDAIEDHLDHIEDVFEDHYGVDLGDLFDVDDDDYYRLRAGYVVRPAVQTIHPVPGPAVVRKYYSTPVVSVPVPVQPVLRVPIHVGVPVPSVRVALPAPVQPVGTKSIGFGPGPLAPVGTKSIGFGPGPLAPVGTKSIGFGPGPVGPVRPVGSGVGGVGAEPTLSPAVVRKIAEEEVVEAVEDIAKNPGTDIQKKAVEVIKEVQEETAEAKKELLEDAAEARKDLLEGDRDDDNDRLPRTA